ncbi:hypothetical protein PSEUDO9AG_40606 [Pseudomonas sp. 9Ag]|nr:hypothetical protein PSEUDO9AG_40606 [Pseudomonas sp. 9Ag]
MSHGFLALRVYRLLRLSAGLGRHFGFRGMLDVSPSDAAQCCGGALSGLARQSRGWAQSLAIEDKRVRLSAASIMLVRVRGVRGVRGVRLGCGWLQ